MRGAYLRSEGFYLLRYKTLFRELDNVSFFSTEMYDRWIFFPGVFILFIHFAGLKCICKSEEISVVYHTLSSSLNKMINYLNKLNYFLGSKIDFIINEREVKKCDIIFQAWTFSKQQQPFILFHFL